MSSAARPPALPSPRDRGRADPEAVLARAALRTARIRRLRGVPPPAPPSPDAAPDAHALTGWENEGGSSQPPMAGAGRRNTTPVRGTVRTRPRPPVH